MYFRSAFTTEITLRDPDRSAGLLPRRRDTRTTCDIPSRAVRAPSGERTHASAARRITQCPCLGLSTATHTLTTDFGKRPSKLDDLPSSADPTTAFLSCTQCQTTHSIV